MADFFQSKSIITLQSLCDNSHLEAEVLASKKKIVVVIPCSVGHYNLGTIHTLLNQLKNISFLYEVCVILNGKTSELVNVNIHTLCAIEPRTTLINALSSTLVGKGFALKVGFDYVYKHYQNNAAIMTLDADLQSCTVDYLLKLVYPIAVLDGDFNKGYYARFSCNKLDGRLTRLLVFPLLYALQLQHATNDLLQWLLSFRYPLSGDVCFNSQLVPNLQLEENWAYDLSLLLSVYNGLDIYQTELSDNYEHLHQSVVIDGEGGLMAVASSLISYLISLYPCNKARLIADYNSLAQQYCDKYRKLSLFNGLSYSQDNENDLVVRISNLIESSLCEMIG